MWQWIKRHVQFQTWSSGEYHIGLAWAQDEWSFEIHLVKPIIKFKGKPAKEA